ncbi:MAG TPA: hypothetical protein VMW62_09985 [Chloroflexota bacterium]|nr:hypothetical protein [Chloroflexota bacterium]
MYAVVRENTFETTKIAQAGPQFAEFQSIHFSQPGYAGTMVIDMGEGRQLTVNL